jgi:formate hydrogenlyase subunit 3/multisubunit Na+/H+ antiporter MnhD subunit
VSPAIGTWPGPLFFLLFTVALAMLAYLVHRWPFLSGMIAAAGCLTLAWIAVRQLSTEQLSILGRTLTLEPSLVVLGRTWALTRSSLAALALIYGMAGLTFLLALPASQGWSFYPFGVGMLGVLSLAVTAQQYVYAILFTWLAANLAVFVLAGGRPGKTAAALRFLVFTSVAVMPLLILPGYLEPDAAGYVVALRADAPPLPDNAGQIATLLMAAGMAVWLMLVPFHGPIVAIGTHSAPMALPLMLTAFPTVVLHTLFRLWQAQPVLMQDPLFFQACRSMGIAAAALGGLSALGQRRWGTLAGYATLVDWGAGLIALGQGTIGGVEWAVQMSIWRAWSLLLVGTGWSALSGAMGQRDDMERCGGLLRRMPLSVLALLVGLLSLAGFPLTPGGAGRWPLLAALIAGGPDLPPARPGWLARWTGLAPAQPGALYALLLAGLGVAIGALAGLRACLGAPQGDAPHGGGQTSRGARTVPKDAPAQEAREARARRREGLEAVVSAGFALLAIWLVASLFLDPRPWLKLVQELLGGLTLPGS